MAIRNISIIFISLFLISAKWNGRDRLKDNLKKQDHKINSLKAKVLSLEKRIGNKNNLMLDQIKRGKQVENLLEELKRNQTQNKSLLNLLVKQSRQDLGRLMLSKMNQERGAYVLIKEKLTQESIKAKYRFLAEFIRNHQKLEETLAKVHKRYKENITVEAELQKVLNSLEEKKQKVAHDYVEELNQKSLLGFELEKIKPKLKALNDISYALIPPLAKVTRFKKDKKGLRLAFEDNEKVIAPEEGKVVFNGKLSTLGHAIMIDHGKGLRTVIIGPIKSKIKKNQQVHKGEILGYTQVKPLSERSLYFEVRKNNEAIDATKNISL